MRQTWQLVSAWVRPIDDDQARAYLTPAEFGLYLKMPRATRQHHLRVLNCLLAAGHHHPSLLKAALLHDVGKIRYSFALPEKVLVVLTKAFAPSLFKKWSAGEPRGWRRPFVMSLRHPEWSAEMGAAVGMDELSLDLIRRHQTRLTQPPQTEADHLLLLLQAADDRS